METTLIFNYKSKKLLPEQKEEVKIQCYHDRKYRYLDTGVFIEQKYWNDVTNEIKPAHPQYKAAMINLSNKLNLLNNYIYDFERSGSVFDFNALELFKSGGKDSLFFCKFIEDTLKMEQKNKKLDYKTVVKYTSNIEIVRELLPDKPLNSITAEDVKGFDARLRAKFATSTTARINVFVQKYLKRAISDGLINLNPYNRAFVDTSRGEGKRLFLTMDELRLLEGFKSSNKTYLLVRDRFLYSCYTGLRISDNMISLRKDIISDTPDGLIVDLHTIKGYGHDLIHPLRMMFDGKPEIIARRWIGAHDEDTLFPHQSDQHINDILKIITGILEIKKNVTFHTARHTCATMLAEITQNPFLMMNLMGWSDVRVAMNYIHASKEATKRQLKVFSGKWNL